MEGASLVLNSVPVVVFVLGLPGLTFAIHNDFPFFRLMNQNNLFLAFCTSFILGYEALCDLVIATPVTLALILHYHSTSVWLTQIQAW